MPRPRFEKLAPEKRQRILDAAAEEFAENGYENASFNRILDMAGISKGAAYYYFDDKADLFATVVLSFWDTLADDLHFDLDSLTADTFWPAIAEAYRQQFHSYRESPLMARVLRAAASFPAEALEDSPLAGPMQEMIALLVGLLQRGQALGVVRDDLPQELMLELVMAIDTASDNWLFANWEALSPEQVEAHVGQVVDFIRRVLEPAPMRK